MCNVVDDGLIRHLLDETGPERRRGDAEDDVVVRDLLLEVFLDRGATGCVTGLVLAAADDEQRVDTAVPASVRLVLESRFTNRPVQRQERRHLVLGAERGSHGDLRIHRG